MREQLLNMQRQTLGRRLHLEVYSAVIQQLGDIKITLGAAVKIAAVNAVVVGYAGAMTSMPNTAP